MCWSYLGYSQQRLSASLAGLHSLRDCFAGPRVDAPHLTFEYASVVSVFSPSEPGAHTKGGSVCTLGERADSGVGVLPQGTTTPESTFFCG